MFDSFTNQLKTFAMSVDSIDDDMLKRVGEALYDYMSDVLAVCYYEVAIDDPNVRSDHENDPVLHVKFCSNSDRIGSLVRLMRDDGNIRTQKAYAYTKGKHICLQMTVQDGLLRTAATEDVAIVPDDLDELPDYACYTGSNDGTAKTAITIPLRYMERKIGVATIEFPVMVEYNQEVREQLQVVCDSVAKICGRFIDTKNNKHDTQRAFAEIVRAVDFKSCGLRSKPVVFLSYSHIADPVVLGAIKEVVHHEDWSDKIAIYDWANDTDPGPISSQIVDQIRASRIGICYLSEKRDDGTFSDNPNVLFEAGMFHVLRGNAGSNLEGWLPIRENSELCGQLPFNFAGDRALIVPRNGEGLNEPLFKERFRQHLERLIGD